MKKTIIALFFCFLGSQGYAETFVFECGGAKVELYLPKEIDWERSNSEEMPKICIFWKKEKEYSRYISSGSMTISKKSEYTPSIMRKKFKSSSDKKEGTWNKLISHKNIYSSDANKKGVSIYTAHYKSKYIAKILADEEEEIVAKITEIEGVVWQNGVLINVGVSLPYKSLTQKDAIKMIKSVKVLKGFDE